jgi:ligand-binding sensor domain-containing protein
MKIFFLTLLSLLYLSAWAQAPKIEIIDNSNSGLPENSLNHIIIDQHGNKWIGTSHSGLIKYNATGFTVYSISNSPLSGKYDEPVYADKNGDIWITEDDKLIKYDGSKWAVYDVKTYSGLSKPVYAASEDANGKMFFGTSDGIITFDGTTWGEVELPGGSIYNYHILSMAVGPNGRMAAGCDTQLLLFDGKEWKKLTEDNSELQLGTVRAVKFTDNGELNIGYGGGLGKGGFSVVKDGKWKHYNKYNSGLPDQMVREIEVSGGDKVKWMATNDGLARMEDNKIEAMKFWPGRYHNVIMGIAVENDNTIWITTTTGLVKLTY